MVEFVARGVCVCVCDAVHAREGGKSTCGVFQNEVYKRGGNFGWGGV